MTPDDASEMDADFAQRMRRGLAAMAPREVARTRRIRRRAAGGALGALALVAVSVLGAQAIGSGADGGAEAVPTPTPSATPTPEPSPVQTPDPSVAPTPEPDPEPTPPPGFEGVAAGVPVVTETAEGSRGDTGAAGGEPYVVHDVYVLCQGAGVVDTPGDAIVDCTLESPWTVIARLGVVTYLSEGDRPSVTLSDDFTGTVRIVEGGETPGGLGVGGVASAFVPCSDVETVGGISFACTSTGSDEYAVEQAAWGIPYPADRLVPAIVRIDPMAGGDVTVRFLLEPSR